MTVPIPIRIAVALVAVSALVFGVWMGLMRIGWSIGSPPAAGTHGPILVLGFLGTVIGMERAVAIGRSWAWITPTLAAASVITMLTGAPIELTGALLLVAGSTLVALFAVAYRMQPEAHIILMGIGAVSWVLAAGTWLAGEPVPALVPWLAAFLILTIAGERLELARLIATTRSSKLQLAAAVAIVIAGSMIAWLYASTGARIAGLGNLLIALWLLRYDIARRTIRLGGVTRYMAAGLLLGYVWLAVSGVLWIATGLEYMSTGYDAALHTLFLGFIMSMIMAHAPIVIPALAGLAFPFGREMWIPLIFLQLSVLVRVTGDLAGSYDMEKWGGMLNATALTILVAIVVATVVRGEVAKRRSLMAA